MGMSRVGVIFDCDGTLLDSMGMWHSLDDRIAERAGVVFTKADRDIFTSSTLDESADHMHMKYGIGTSGSHVAQMIKDELMGYYESEATTRAGVDDLVRGLHELGIPMAVASSTPSEYLLVGLETVGLAPYFESVVSVEDIRSSKREPLVYDKARESLGTARELTWGVEDAAYALQTLMRAGYRTCGIYDTDIAGTFEQLSEFSELTLRSFDHITPQTFLDLAVSGRSAWSKSDGAANGPSRKRQASEHGQIKSRDPQIRAANEDDDGYDPYSDRTERAPLFERDPWD